MPRQPRLDLPGIPQHVIQRGNDRQPCFFSSDDYERYRSQLREISLREGCAIHGYVLMTNHVHLLVTPSTTGAIARMMQALGRRYVRHVNDRYHRTGTLWEGRYKACPVDTETYFLQCLRYIELNPVRARMVADPADYPWSSHTCNALRRTDALVTPHPCWRALASSAQARCATYRRFVLADIDPAETEAIRLFLQRQHALGSARFRAAIETQLGRRAGPATIGRPRKDRSVRESAL